MTELLIGCGNDRRRKMQPWSKIVWDDLTTLDIDPDVGADVVHDLEKLPLPFDDDAFDEIHAYCVLEHVGTQGDYRFFFDQWTEFWRITKSGGVFCGIVPRYDSPWAWADPSHKRVLPAECFVFLDQAGYEQIGERPMTDFRSIYKADWHLVFKRDEEHHLLFVLEAIK